MGYYYWTVFLSNVSAWLSAKIPYSKAFAAGFYAKPRFLKMVMALGAAACFNQLAIFVTQIVMNNVLRYYGALSIYGSDIPLAVVGVGSKVNMVFLSIVIGISQGAQQSLDLTTVQLSTAV